MDNCYPPNDEINANYNNNHNENINNNNNNAFPFGGITPFIPDDGVNIFLLNNRIRTSNGLFLVDASGSVVQEPDGPSISNDRWDIVGGTIRNVQTGRYMALQSNSTATGIPIITIENPTSLSNWTIRRQPDQPILPPPPPRYFIFNAVSRRPMEVPDNTSLPGQAILQGSLRSGNIAGQSFFF